MGQAMRKYAYHHGLKLCNVTAEQVEKSSAGIKGWAEAVVIAGGGTPALHTGGKSKVENAGGGKPKKGGKAAVAKDDTAAQARARASAKVQDTQVAGNEREAKELLSTISILDIDSQSFTKMIAADPVSCGWMTQFVESYTADNARMLVAIDTLGGFFHEFKASATSAKNLSALKKRLQDL